MSPVNEPRTDLNLKKNLSAPAIAEYVFKLNFPEEPIHVIDNGIMADALINGEVVFSVQKNGQRRASVLWREQ